MLKVDKMDEVVNKLKQIINGATRFEGEDNQKKAKVSYILL